MNSDSSANSSDTTPSANESSLSSHLNSGSNTNNSSSQQAIDDMTSPNTLLREYSQELYDYTLGLLTLVKKDEATRVQTGKAHIMKRGISDAAISRKPEV